MDAHVNEAGGVRETSGVSLTCYKHKPYVSDGFVLAEPPRRWLNSKFCSTHISNASSSPVHPRSLQAATVLSNLLVHHFLEDPPLSVSSQKTITSVWVVVVWLE